MLEDRSSLNKSHKTATFWEQCQRSYIGKFQIWVTGEEPGDEAVICMLLSHCQLVSACFSFESASRYNDRTRAARQNDKTDDDDDDAEWVKVQKTHGNN